MNMISVEFLLLSLGVAGFCGMVYFTIQPGYFKRLLPRISTQEESRAFFQERANNFLDKVKKGDPCAVQEITTRINDPTWKYFGVILDLKQEVMKIIKRANKGDLPKRAILESVMRRQESRYFGMVRKSTTNPENFEFVDPDEKRLVFQVKAPDLLWHSSGPMPLKGKHPGMTTRTQPLGDHMA